MRRHRRVVARQTITVATARIRGCTCRRTLRRLRAPVPALGLLRRHRTGNDRYCPRFLRRHREFAAQCPDRWNRSQEESLWVND